VTCTSGTAYTISLDGGFSGATNPTQRKMTKGSEFITYGLYRDASGTLPFRQHEQLVALGATKPSVFKISHSHSLGPTRRPRHPAGSVELIGAVQGSSWNGAPDQLDGFQS